MKKLIRLALAVLVLGAIAVGGIWYFQNRTAAAASTTSGGTYTQVVTVEQGNLTATISVVGQLEAVQSAELRFEEMSGTTQVLSMTVGAGSTVAAGQVLATIDAAPYGQALDQARSDLQAAEEVLADLMMPPTDLEIAQADLAVAKAQFQLQKAQDSLDDLLHPDLVNLESAVVSAQVALAQAQADLLAQQDSSNDQLDRLRDAEAKAWEVYAEWADKAHSESDEGYSDRLTLLYNKMMDAQDQRVTAEVQAQLSALQAQSAVRKQQRALAEAQEALAEAKAGGDELALTQATVAVEEAQVSLELAQEARAELEEGSDASEVATAQANVDKKRLVVSEAEAALAGTELVAPFDGTVLEVYVSQGEQVTANTSVLSLADLETMQVVASVDETAIRQVSAGQDAVISFDAFPGQTFEGEVLTVPMQWVLQGGVTVYEVPISLAGAEELNLLVGMTANVEIQVGSVTDALLVPTLALQKVNGEYQVMVPNTTDASGAAETVPVEVGLSNGTYTQVVKGLNAGDQVLVQLESTQSGNTGGSGSAMSGTLRFLGGR